MKKLVAVLAIFTLSIASAFSGCFISMIQQIDCPSGGIFMSVYEFQSDQPCDAATVNAVFDDALDTFAQNAAVAC